MEELIDTSKKARQPAVIVDNVHVNYKVFATGKRAGSANKTLFQRRRQVLDVHALRGVSFLAYENESIGIIGHNGSGKSTLMRTITGLTPASQGAVYAASRPNLLGVGAALINELSGEQNIILGGLAMGFSMQEIEALKEEIIDFSGLRKFIHMPMRTYSSGMSQRLKFAIATAKTHEILIIDEALAVGDKGFRKKSEAKIQQMREAAGTVFLVSHSMNAIRSMCDRVLWIHKGKLRMDGCPDEVIAAYEESK